MRTLAWIWLVSVGVGLALPIAEEATAWAQAGHGLGVLGVVCGTLAALAIVAGRWPRQPLLRPW